MTKTAIIFWNLLQEYCDFFSKRSLPISLSNEKKDQFIDNARKDYEEYKRLYMVPGTECLDRHKIAAILITTGLDCEILHTSVDLTDVPNDMIIVSAEKILFRSAIDYLISEINVILEKANQTRSEKNKLVQLQDFLYPQALCSNISYFNLFCHELHYSWKPVYSEGRVDRLCHLNEMDLANELFLLEYITILKTYPENSDEYFYALKNTDMD